MDMETVLTNLKRRGFEARYFDEAEEAADDVAGSLSGQTIGFGGSVTVESLGLYERLGQNNTVLWHWKEPAPDLQRRASAAPVYIASANAIAATGEIVNIDGTGNRVAAMQFGKERVYIICGVNKLTDTLPEAICRAREVAAPKNAARLGRQTPCVADGKCHDCASPERICQIEVVFRGKPMGVAHMEVILIGQTLGY